MIPYLSHSRHHQMQFMKRDLAELWFKKTKVQFGNYQTVKQVDSPVIR